MTSLKDMLESMKIDIEATLDESELAEVEDATVADYAAEVITMLQKFYLKR